MLINLSQTGALLSVPEKLKLKTPMTFVVAPDKFTLGEPEPIQIVVSPVREASQTDDGCHTYGCQILRVDDPN